MSGERRDPQYERFADLKEAYALGALTESERREFKDLLAAHPELQAEIDDLQSTANLLALAPQEQEPPPELRRNLLSSIGAAEDTPEAPVAAPDATAPSRAGLFGPAGYAAGALAAVAALAILGLLVWNVSLRGENEDLRGEAQSRQNYELQGSGTAQDVRGEVIELGDGRAVLMADDLPSVSEDEVYEAWLLRAGVPEPAGLFEPHNGTAAMPIEGSVEGADAVAVTVEPSGGSSMPTSEPLLTAAL